ncbi:MAG: GNAT family N-acetyltransferase [Phenylobacterium sp.]
MAESLTVTMNAAASRFEVSLDGETAFADYHLHPDHITLPHTVVPPAFEGKGVGSALAKAALGYAREHGLTVKPVCPFIAGYIQKHPEWADIVDPTFREELGV